ncbi:MAG: hypothetical protein R3A50_00250 [Saprospiraceae bacterium]
MNNSKLFQLLQTFSSVELRELSKFAANPYFNQRSETNALLQMLIKSWSEGRNPPSKESIHKTIFGKGNYNDHRIRMAMSALLRIAEKYLVTKSLLDDKPAYQLRLSQILEERNLPNLANTAWQYGFDALAQDPERNSDHFYQEYVYQEEKYKAIQNSPEVETMDLQPLSDQLDIAFISRKLAQACFLLAHQARYNSTCDFGLLETILPKAEDYLHYPAVSVYYYCYQSLTQATQHHFFRSFKEQLFQCDELFTVAEMQDLYILAINYCTRRYNEGELAFLQDQFDLYKIGFEKGIFMPKGILSRFTYLNAATIALKIKEYAWLEDFIRHYKAYLELPYQDSLFAFNMARLEYQQKHYGDALLLLQKAEYRETMLALAAKTLQLKIYYESGEFDLLLSHLQAITAFIRRKKIMGYHRDNYLNLVQFVNRLLEVAPGDKSTRQSLRSKIEASKPLAEKEWLLEQV